MLKIEEKRIVFDKDYYDKIEKEGELYYLPLPQKNRNLSKPEVKELVNYILEGKSKKFICSCFNLSDHYIKNFFNENFNTKKIAEVRLALKQLEISAGKKDEKPSLHILDTKK